MVITVFTSNIIDKIATAVLVFGIMKVLPAKTQARFAGTTVAG